MCLCVRTVYSGHRKICFSGLICPFHLLLKLILSSSISHRNKQTTKSHPFHPFALVSWCNMSQLCESNQQTDTKSKLFCFVGTNEWKQQQQQQSINIHLTNVSNTLKWKAEKTQTIFLSVICNKYPHCSSRSGRKREGNKRDTSRIMFTASCVFWIYRDLHV